MGARLIVSGHSHHHGEVRVRGYGICESRQYIRYLTAQAVHLLSLPTIMDSLV